jgi:hypothetical protein
MPGAGIACLTRCTRAATNFAMIKSTLCTVMSGVALLIFLLPRVAAADDQGSAKQGSATAVTNNSSDTSEDDPPESQKHKRIFGIIPNNRTSDQKEPQTLTPKEKFSIAVEDNFDRGTYMLASGFAGYGQLRDSTPSFGHGVKGYARYWVASYTDLAVGNVMTEAIYPVILHQDPRYFRRGTGSRWSRLGYAAGQIFVTHSDSGTTQFNFSEILGNLTAVGIANAYYPDNRNVPDNGLKFGIQIGTDMTGNILKEFAPDLGRAFSRVFHRAKD